MARNCRNREIGGRIGESKRLEYKNRNNEQNNRQSNLNMKKDLIISN